MHAAPPVRVSVGGSPLWIGAVAALSATAAANVLAWLAAVAAWPGSMALVVPAALAAAGVAGHWAHRKQAGGELAWTGECWHWLGWPGHAHVALDLDRWMLLRFDAQAGRRRWIALEQRRVQGPWAGLRAALYAPSRPDGRDAAPPV